MPTNMNTEPMKDSSTAHIRDRIRTAGETDDTCVFAGLGVLARNAPRRRLFRAETPSPAKPL